MKRTTLRTSAIALGVAAALPATAQEWNLGWGGYMNQHIVFGSNEKKTTVNPNDLSFTVTGNTVDGAEPSDRTSSEFRDFQAGKYTANIRIVESHSATVPNPNNRVPTAITALENVIDAGDTSALDGIITGLRAGNADATEFDLVLAVGDPTNIVAGTRFAELHKRIDAVNGAIKSSGTSQWPDAEIHFKPSITLENGLTFGAHVEFEALHHDRGGATRDESYVTISSDSLGMFIIGSENSAGYRMMVAAPSVGLGINSGSHPDFLPGYGYEWRSASGSSNTEVGGNNDAMRVSYHTPNLGGLTLGISYAPDNGVRKNDEGKYVSFSNNSGKHQLQMDDDNIPLKDIIDLGVKFEQSLGDANVTLAARYGTGKRPGAAKNLRETGFGAQVGFGAFTVGGAYADSERGSADKSSSGWSLGMAYDMDGPWKFGIETYQGKYDDGDKQGVSKIAASRTLGPGVVWDLYALTASSTQTQGKLNVGGVAQKLVKPGDSGEAGEAGIDLHSSGKIDVDGTLFGTSIKLTF